MTEDERFCALDLKCIQMRENGEEYSYIDGYNTGYYIGYCHAREDFKNQTHNNCKDSDNFSNTKVNSN